MKEAPNDEPITKNKMEATSKLIKLNVIKKATIPQKKGIANIFKVDKIMPVKKEFLFL